MKKKLMKLLLFFGICFTMLFSVSGAYTITYVANHDAVSDAPTSQEATAGSPVVLNAPAPTYNIINIQFTGWSLDIDATEPEYQDGDEFLQDVDTDVTLYGVWANATAIWEWTIAPEDADHGKEITLKTNNEGKIYWGDGTSDVITTDDFSTNIRLSHIYSSVGSSYRVRIVECDLTELRVPHNRVTALYVIASPNLINLDCGYNQLRELDLNDNKKLQVLDCAGNELTSFDLSSNLDLRELRCASNIGLTLDVSANEQLTWLSCSYNGMTEINLSSNINLTHLECDNNNISDLDVSANDKLTVLYCFENNITSLELSSNVDLQNLYCSNNLLESLDISENVNLDSLTCSSNSLTTLDISKNVNLTSLMCDSNELTTLDVTNNVKLTTLWCNSNMLTQLDLSKNGDLTTLHCDTNGLSQLDVSNNTKLEQLYCEENLLTQLDVSNHPELLYLCCDANQLSELDISRNPKLYYLEAAQNTELLLIKDSKQSVGPEEGDDTKVITIIQTANGTIEYVGSNTFTITPNTGYAVNYVFAHGIEYEGITEYTFAEVGETDDISATFAATFEVSYDANGGSGAPEVQTKIDGIDLTLSSIEPVKMGHTFMGWAINSSATQSEYSAGGTFTENENVTLYAVWTPSTYTVVFDSQGGVAGTATVTVQYGSQMPVITVPTKEDYIFDGYYTTPNGTGTHYYKYDGTSSKNWDIGSDTTLYAKWLEGIEVNFESNGGTAVNRIVVANGRTYGTLPTPTKTGYIFCGWYSTNELLTEINSTTIVAESVAHNLYASWDAIEYVIVYEGNENTAGTTAESNHTYDIESTLTENGFTKTGYIFKEWNTAENGSGTSYTDGQIVTNLTEIDGETITLYAQWKVPTSTDIKVGDYVEYQPTGEIIDLTELTGITQAPLDPTQTTRWRVLNNDGSKIELISEYSVVDLTLSEVSTRQADGAFSEGNEEIFQTAQTNFANIVYILDEISKGYAKGVVGGRAFGVSEDTVEKIDTDLYPVTYSGALANASEPYSDTYYQADINNIENNNMLHESGKVWMASRNFVSSSSYANFGGRCGSSYVNSSTCTVDWIRMINDNSNGEASSFEATAGVRPIIILDTEFEIEGDGSDSNPWRFIILLSDTYLVKYDANGGVGAPAEQSKIYGEDLILRTTIPTRSGYTFLGWSTTSSSSTVEYEAGSSYTDEAGITLYAVWKKQGMSVSSSTSQEEEKVVKEYIIQVKSNEGGQISPSGEITVTEGKSKTFYITLKEGYEIEEVLVDGESIGVVNEYTFSNITKDHELEAVFKKIQTQRTKGNILLIMGKINNFEEVLCPLKVLLSAYKIDGQTECISSNATLKLEKDIVKFENGNINVLLNNEMIELTKPVKILNGDVYITVIDFLKLI